MTRYCHENASAWRGPGLEAQGRVPDSSVQFLLSAMDRRRMAFQAFRTLRILQLFTLYFARTAL
jgi:hypothetical protein